VALLLAQGYIMASNPKWVTTDAAIGRAYSAEWNHQTTEEAIL